MSNHAPEPWKVVARYSEYCGDIIDAKDKIICVALNKEAKRIIACVNACQGFTTEHLETIVKEGESLLIRLNRAKKRLEDLEKQIASL